MTVLKLVDHNNPILHNRVEEFDPESIDMKQTIDDMFETMYHYKGIGLSANQVGLPYRIFIMGTPETELVFINPVIRSLSKEQEAADEGCLTHPGLYVKIKRSTEVRLFHSNLHGESRALTYKGMTARIIQHEMDHLEGIDYQRRANRIHLERARNQLKKWKRRNDIL
jgi:peptide deformylase